MKKIIKIFSILLILLSVTICNAEELDCNYVLKKGSIGSRVKQLQNVLNEKTNCNLSIDGSFGNLTKNCVIKYQKENNLVQDGIVGPNTCNSLNGVNVSEKSDVIKTYKKDNNTYAIVLESKINVRKNSTTKSEILTQLKRGTIVNIIDISNNWYKININGTTGYVRNDLLSKDCIIVDISEQTLYFYEDGNLKWSTKVVTGNEGNHDTPVGNYKLNKRNYRTETYLRGYNDDGSRYNSYVDYWMPFITNKGIGFHDASWRSSWEYTSSRYKGHGSHGCVNMQHEAAEKLYNEEIDIIDVVVRD